MDQPMEKPESVDWENVTRLTVSSSLGIKIPNFSATKPDSNLQRKMLRHPDFEVEVTVHTFAHGVDAKTKGWLVVLSEAKVSASAPLLLEYAVLSCTVSVIDVEGNPRFPRHFVRNYESGIEAYSNARYLENCHSDAKFLEKCHSDARYLERSSIYHRADEFLSEDVLTLRVDIRYDVLLFNDTQLMINTCNDFRSLIDKGWRHSVNGKLYTYYDFTSQNRALLGKRFIICENPSVVELLNKDSVEGRAALEHIWIFDTGGIKFLVSLDEQQDSVGVRFVKASPVIKQIVNTDMKERREKRIVFQNTISDTLLFVMFFLETGTLPILSATYQKNFDTTVVERILDFFFAGKKREKRKELTIVDSETIGNVMFLLDQEVLDNAVLVELVDAYNFSHLYGMEVLQRKCTEAMVKNLEFPTAELRKIAVFYSDGYLAELLESRPLDDENFERTGFKIIDRPDFHCYI